MKRVMLYFGSFNPIHKGHISLAEYVVEQKLCDEVALVISPQNPLKPIGQQAPELERFNMAEIACQASKYPERIKASVVEFLLERPSYTINTLRYLTENFGSEMSFTILMGGDLIDQIDKWKDYEEILDNYHIYIYPRRGAIADRVHQNITYLDSAPLYDYSSTAIRDGLMRGEDMSTQLDEGVMRYIRDKGLWSAAAIIATLNADIDKRPDDAELYIERGKWHYRRNEWGEALNDFNQAVKLCPDHTEAKQFISLIQEILAFRYKDIYNP